MSWARVPHGHVFVRVMEGELRRGLVVCSVCMRTRQGRDDAIAPLTQDPRKLCTDISGDSVILKEGDRDIQEEAV